MNGTDGNLSAYIVDRKPTARLRVEFPLVATHNVEGRIKAGTLGAFSATTNGAAGNDLTISTPGTSSWQYHELGLEDDGGILVADIGAACVRTAAIGEDELRLAFA